MMFFMGNLPWKYRKGLDFTYNFQRMLHMHRGQEGYNMKNEMGQEVLVTKPFRFGRGRGVTESRNYIEGGKNAILWCPKYHTRSHVHLAKEEK